MRQIADLAVERQAQLAQNRGFEFLVPPPVERAQVVEILTDRKAGGHVLVFGDIADLRKFSRRDPAGVDTQYSGMAARRRENIH